MKTTKFTRLHKDPSNVWKLRKSALSLKRLHGNAKNIWTIGR